MAESTEIPQKDRRVKCEAEAKKDLNKDIEQLLADVHEEIANAENDADKQIGHALKRSSSMMAIVAKKNAKLSTWMFLFTIILTLLGIVQIILLILKK